MKKYEKVFQADYRQWYSKNRACADRVQADSYRLSYHLMPETGWLNDPNGLCQFHGEYHIYYQYTPFEPTGEVKLWGHYTTRDFIHYNNCEPVLFPDKDFDAHGVYSGSAFIEEDVIHYFYTGNVKMFDRDDYDYIMAGRESNTVHVTSGDGFHFSEKERLMTNKDYPADISAHVRDPKIIKGPEGYYMVLGARDKEGRGLVLVYHSKDMKQWQYHGRITTKEPFGYMWECPDLFVMDGQLFLICCPQGVKRQGVDFENVHQCVTVRLDYDFSPGTYELSSLKEVRMLDRGFDFYAPQTFEDQKGRRILIGWMGIPDAAYTNPTTDAGWQHALTIPRVLHKKNGRLIQTPLEELKALRGFCRRYEGLDKMQKEASETGVVYEAEINFDSCESMELQLRRGAKLTYDNGLLTLDISAVGSGRTARKVCVPSLARLHIFSDTSSLEIFVNEGEEVFTTRLYGLEGRLACAGKCSGNAEVYELSGFDYEKVR